MGQGWLQLGRCESPPTPANKRPALKAGAASLVGKWHDAAEGEARDDGRTTSPSAYYSHSGATTQQVMEDRVDRIGPETARRGSNWKSRVRAHPSARCAPLQALPAGAQGHGPWIKQLWGHRAPYVRRHPASSTMSA